MNKKTTFNAFAFSALVLAICFPAPWAVEQAHADPTGCTAGQMLGSVSGSLGCMVNGTVGSLAVTGTNVPVNGIYLPAANTPAITVNSIALLKMDESGTTAEHILGDRTNGTAENVYLVGSGGNLGSIGCAQADNCSFNSVGSTYLVFRTNGSTAIDVTPTQLVRFKAGVQGQDGTPVVTGTGTPTLASGSSDTAGEATGGTLATSIVITFSSAKTNAPFCTVTSQSSVASFGYSVSTTAITVTLTATTAEKINYICFQR